VLIVIVALVFHGFKGYTQASALFESEEILEFTLKFDKKTLQKGRVDDPPYQEATLHYQESGTSYEIPLRIKPRGNFRKIRTNCNYPPIWINFKKSLTPKSSIFKDQDKTKLVTPCRGEEYVVHECLV
jgi:hypothetical protein